MRLYEQTYYDLMETMRKRHRKFQLKKRPRRVEVGGDGIGERERSDESK